ncbi:hypothetical protein Glove_294g165 [Diversispora epigaea]|uniref:Uncharacterized protein n=1 Tax=Diversispora epigaea TaxID=1348612 RepID=A0A397HZD6_9GLOM|nr:hypothetical protein Glove_294g165 [Diversispora epigaea]
MIAVAGPEDTKWLSMEIIWIVGSDHKAKLSRLFKANMIAPYFYSLTLQIPHHHIRILNLRTGHKNYGCSCNQLLFFNNIKIFTVYTKATHLPSSLQSQCSLQLKVEKNNDKADYDEKKLIVIRKRKIGAILAFSREKQKKKAEGSNYQIQNRKKY